VIAIIDNYDSFTYNLYQMIGALAEDVRVWRNDAISVADLAAAGPSHIVLSPGPGYPAQAGICLEVVRALAGRVPILGVCLGHQAICQAWGAPIVAARAICHGKQSPISIVADDPVLAGLPSPFLAGRYHSLAADPAGLPADLVVTALADDQEIQAVRHRHLPLHGVQFHPESILTPLGGRILANFVALPPPTTA
jgi:anthranilate synthase component 2